MVVKAAKEERKVAKVVARAARKEESQAEEDRLVPKEKVRTARKTTNNLAPTRKVKMEERGRTFATSS